MDRKNKAANSTNILLLIVIVLLLGVIGYLIFDKKPQTVNPGTATTQMNSNTNVNSGASMVASNTNSSVASLNGNANAAPQTNTNSTQPSTPGTGLSTYTSKNYGFTFQYPSMWAKVMGQDTSSSDYLPAGRSFVAIYPAQYPAQDFSGRVDVYRAPLKTVLKDSPFLKGMAQETEVFNSLKWTRIGAGDGVSYLIEKNGRTYEVAGSKEVAGQVVSTFVFSK